VLGGTAGLRWALPAALLVAEYLTLSILVDLPMSGPAMGLVEMVRLAVPVAIGGGAGAWLLTRHSARPGMNGMAARPPAWRPWPALVAHLAAFAGTAAFAYRLLREGAPPVTTSALAAWLACVAVTALLALSSAAPLRWTVRFVATRWRVPLIALALGLLSWRAAAVAEGLWGVLSAGTLRSVAWLIRHVAGTVTVDPARNLIGLAGFEVMVAPICSGVDGLGLVVLFQAIWISLARSRLRPLRALVLLPLGAVSALAANVLRITILILVGASGRTELAYGGLHSKLGWLLFIAIALGSVALAERVPWLRRSGTGAAAEDEGVPPAAAAYLAPLLGAIGMALVAGIWSEGPLDRGYGARILAALVALFLVRKYLPRPSLSWSWAPVLLAAGASALWIAAAGGDGRALAAALARLGAAERWTWIATRAAGSCLVIPVAEELAFRGFLLPWLVSPDFENMPPGARVWPAVLVSSLAFGALHQQWLGGTAAGLAFAAARLRRGRLGDAILAHALCNAGITAAVLLGGRWDLWG
jgi:exosortase E/protease (VPEID-CTERM system)